MLEKGKERFIEVEIKKGKKVNKRSKICFVHFILSRIVWKTTWEKTDIYIKYDREKGVLFKYNLNNIKMVYQRIIDFSRQSAVVTFKLLRALISNELDRGREQGTMKRWRRGNIKWSQEQDRSNKKRENEGKKYKAR